MNSIKCNSEMFIVLKKKCLHAVMNERISTYHPSAESIRVNCASCYFCALDLAFFQQSTSQSVSNEPRGRTPASLPLLSHSHFAPATATSCNLLKAIGVNLFHDREV